MAQRCTNIYAFQDKKTLLKYFDNNFITTF